MTDQNAENNPEETGVPGVTPEQVTNPYTMGDKEVDIARLVALQMASIFFFLKNIRAIFGWGDGTGRTFVDIGGGVGYFTCEIAKMYPKARVIIYDRNQDHIDFALKRAKSLNLTNVEGYPTNVTEELPNLEGRCVDAYFVGLLLVHFNKAAKTALFSLLKKYAKPHAKIWNREGNLYDLVAGLPELAKTHIGRLITVLEKTGANPAIPDEVLPLFQEHGIALKDRFKEDLTIGVNGGFFGQAYLVSIIMGPMSSSVWIEKLTSFPAKDLAEEYDQLVKVMVGTYHYTLIHSVGEFAE